MHAPHKDGKFENISQRAASSYARMLPEFCPVFPDGIDPTCQAEMTAAQADLHAFFERLYGQLVSDPALFGLPLTEDVFLIADHAKEGPSKADMNRFLDKPKKLINEGLDFLYQMGLRGRLEGDALVLEVASPGLDTAAPPPALLGKKSGRAWLAGMQSAGIVLESSGGTLRMTNAHFPKMMPALQVLAQACAGSPDADLGRLFFTRCDFNALKQDFAVQALDLYRVFGPEDYGRAAALHAFFTGRSYRPEVSINSKLSWSVKYQGKKSIKASPLFQIDFDERLLHPLRAGIKCASAPRIVGLLPAQSEALQDDFARRAFNCSDCGWCRNKKAHRPTEYVHRGELRRVCWYVNSDVEDFNDETVALVQEYARMHEALEET